MASKLATGGKPSLVGVVTSSVCVSLGSVAVSVANASILSRYHDRTSDVSAVAIGGLPITHPAFFLILGGHTVAGTLRDADPDVEVRVTVRGKHAFGAGHVGTGVDA